jgi:S-adenosylmethionine-diacylglycerol 3-amino-3-carboxypropyl transferase
VDSNPAQIFLVALKMRAIQKLDYDDFVGFVGARPCHRRLRLYQHLRPTLSEGARDFWDGQRESLELGIIHCGKFENYFSLFRRLVLPLIHPRGTVRQLLAAWSAEEQRTLYDQTWNNRRWRWLFRLFFGKFLLGHLGRRPSYFRYVKIDDVAEELLRRTKHGLSEIPIHDNFFVEYILTGAYRNLETAHPYLAESNFRFLQGNVGRMRLVCASLQEHLRGLPPGSVSKFNLSDIFEYVSEEALEGMLQDILRVCCDDARLAYWTLLVDRDVPPSLSDRINPCTSVSSELFAGNRTFFYGSFGLWQAAKGESTCRECGKAKVNSSVGR